MERWPPDVLTESLAGLLTRSSQAVASALARLADVNTQLQALVEISPDRPWTSDEFGRYYALVREERKAHRRYDAARDWYDGVRRRIRQRAAHLGHDS